MMKEKKKMMIVLNTIIGYDGAGGDQCECECECHTKSLLSKGDSRVTIIAAHLMKQLICWHGTSANHCSSQALFRIKRWHSHGSRLKNIPARWNLLRPSEKRTWPIFILK